MHSVNDDLESATVATTNSDEPSTTSLEGNVSPGGKLHNEKRKRQNRLIMAAYTIVMLWSMSPNVAFNLAGRVVGDHPSWDQVKTFWENHEEYVKLIDAAGERCVNDAASACMADLEQVTETLNMQVTEANAVNRAVVEFVEYEQGDDQETVVSLYTLVNTLDGALPLTNSSTCTADDRELIHARLGGNFNSILSDTSDITSDFLDDVGLRIERLVNYAKERSSYDAEYLANKTGVALSEVNLFGNFSSPDLSDIFDDLRENLFSSLFCGMTEGEPCHFRVLTNAIEELLGEANALLTYLGGQVNDFRSAIQAMGKQIDELNRLVLNIYGGLQIAKETFPNLPSFFSGGIDIDNLPALPPGVSFFPSSLNVIPTWEELSLSLPLEQFEANMAISIDELFRNARSAVQLRLDASLPNVTALSGILSLDDYNPPLYSDFNSSTRSPDDEVSQFHVLGEKFAEDISGAIDSVSAAGPDLSGDLSIEIPLIDLRNVTNDVAQASVRLIPFGELSFAFPFAWSILVFLLQYRPYLILAYNVYNTLKKLWRYWEKTSIPLPVVDDTQSSREEEEKPRRSLRAKVASVVFSGQFEVSLAWAVQIFVILLLGFVYSTYFGHYHSRCVATRLGTDLSHSWVVPYYSNMGTQGTNRAYATRFNEYQHESNRICSLNYFESAQRHQEDVVDAYLQEIKANETQTELSRLDRCFDFEAARVDIAQIVPPQHGELANAIFTCEDLPQCDLHCGAKEREIADATNEAVCIAEWHIHGVIWGSTLAVVGAYLLWLARVAMENGSKRALWRYLRDEKGPNLLTSAENYTDFFLQGNVCSLLPRPKPGIKRMKKAARGFQFKGLIQCTFGAFVAVCYIVGMYLIQKENDRLRPIWYGTE